MSVLKGVLDAFVREIFISVRHCPSPIAQAFSGRHGLSVPVRLIERYDVVAIRHTVITPGISDGRNPEQRDHGQRGANRKPEIETRGEAGPIAKLFHVTLRRRSPKGALSAKLPAQLVQRAHDAQHDPFRYGQQLVGDKQFDAVFHGSPPKAR